MAQDGFSTATPRPSARSGPSQGAKPANSGPAGSGRPGRAPAGSSRSAPSTPAAAAPATVAPIAPMAPLAPPSIATRSVASIPLGSRPAPAGSSGGSPAGGPLSRPSDDDEVLTVDELVAWLRLSESTVLKLLSERAIPARKVGHQWRVRRGRVRDWLDGRE